MLKFTSLLTLIGCILSSPVSAAEESRPNILFILVDDLGYADLGCRGSKEIRTPHIDGLAVSGLRFTDAYVTAPQCGPSRAGIMTGVQPERYKRDANAFKTDFLTDAAIDFIKSKDKKPWFLYLSYTAPHTPLQAKQKDIAANTHIKDPNRRIFAGMMTCLDHNIGRILKHLDKQGLRENTLVVFLSDNGGPTGKNTSRNAPFSGVKGDVYEGGIRVPMIASWPGTLAKGKVISDPVISLDPVSYTHLRAHET